MKRGNNKTSECLVVLCVSVMCCSYLPTIEEYEKKGTTSMPYKVAVLNPRGAGGT